MQLDILNEYTSHFCCTISFDFNYSFILLILLILLNNLTLFYDTSFSRVNFVSETVKLVFKDSVVLLLITPALQSKFVCYCPWQIVHLSNNQCFVDFLSCVKDSRSIIYICPQIQLSYAIRRWVGAGPCGPYNLGVFVTNHKSSPNSTRGQEQKDTRTSKWAGIWQL